MSINIFHRCTSTPLYILYLAGAVSMPLAWRSRGLLLVVAVPVFYLLNVFRVVGLVWTQAYVPRISLFVGNFFFQISLIFALSGALGWWLSQGLDQTRQRRFWLRLTAGYAASLGLWWLLGGVYDRLVSSGYQGVIGMISMTGLTGIRLAAELPQDPYRILQFMPAFQMVILGAFAVVCVWHWQAILGSVLGIYVSQIGFFVGVATLNQLYAIDPHVRYFRAWVVVVPFGLVWMLARKKYNRDTQAVPTGSADNAEKAAPTRPAPALQ
jgi:exosortase/archaeosortase family protein